ncbi:MAG TPA: hypothetical protein VNV60_06510 [Holophagaceae bacterium]|jgi:hypothetical protein|nr:hypothetical protein [Holophagaceae bacterium]
MRPLCLRALLLASVVLSGSAARAQDPGPTLEAWGKARGGAEAIHAIQSLRVMSHVYWGSTEIPVVTEYKRPGRYRQVTTVQGLQVVEALDGESGWSINPFSGYGGFMKPQPMNPEDLRDAKESADFDGPFVDWKAKGNQVSDLGDEEVEGSPARKLQAKLSGGTVVTSWLDKDSGLEIKRVTRHMVRGSEQETETLLGNYFKHGGVWLPHLLETGPVRSEARNKAVVDKVEVNIAIDDADFKMPEPTKVAQ